MNPRKIRELFAILITNCGLSQPLEIWNAFKDSMSEDILHTIQQHNRNADYNQNIYNEAMIDLQNIVLSISGKSLHDCGFPHVQIAQTNLDI